MLDAENGASLRNADCANCCDWIASVVVGFSSLDDMYCISVFSDCCAVYATHFWVVFYQVMRLVCTYNWWHVRLENGICFINFKKSDVTFQCNVTFTCSDTYYKIGCIEYQHFSKLMLHFMTACSKPVAGIWKKSLHIMRMKSVVSLGLHVGEFLGNCWKHVLWVSNCRLHM